MVDVRNTARQLGGRNAHRPKPLLNPARMFEVKSASDIVELACTTINETRIGFLDAHRANAIGVLLKVVLDTYQLLEKRQPAPINKVEGSAGTGSAQTTDQKEMDELLEEWYVGRRILDEYKKRYGDSTKTSVAPEGSGSEPSKNTENPL